MSSLLRVIFDPDQTPPGVPSITSVTAVGQGRLDITWTSVTDTGGSGLAGYQILKDGGTTIPIGIQTTYSDTGLTPGSVHTYRVRSFDAAVNFSVYSSQAQGTVNAAPAAYSPNFPRLGAYILGGTQRYDQEAIVDAMARRHINIVSHYPGWQNGKLRTMAQVTADVKSRSTIGSKFFTYILYESIPKSQANPGNANWELWQQAANNNLFAYTNGVAETGPVDSFFGATHAKCNYTTAGKVISGKRWYEFVIDWSIRLNRDGGTMSNGTSSLTAAANPQLDGLFIDNCFYRERNPAADFDRNGTVDDILGSTASRTLIQESHAAAMSYVRSSWPASSVMVNSADWFLQKYTLGLSFTGTPMDQQAEGGVIEAPLGKSFSPETYANYATTVDAINIQMNGYRSPKLGVLTCDITSATNYQMMRYGLGTALLTDAYYYPHTGNYAAEDLPSLWFDEFSFNLGTATEPVQTAPRYLAEAGNTGGGVWRRDFQNGIVLVGARRANGSGAGDQTTPYASVALGGTFYRLPGTQDSVTNNGTAVTSVAIRPRDALVLSRTPVDTIVPSVPGALSATTTSSTAITLSWNASTDTGGSGLAGYDVQINGTTIIPIGVQTSYLVTSLTPATLYTFRVRSRDGAGNTSSYSNQAQAATQAAAGPPVWNTQPTPTFTFGVAANYPLDVTDPNSDPLTLSLAPSSVALPAGVTLNSALKRLEYSGGGVAGTTGGIIIRADDAAGSVADADWVARRTAAGVVAFYGFDTDISGYQAGSNGTRGFLDTSTRIGSGGSLRFDLRAGESGANIAGSWTKTAAPWAFTTGFGQNTDFYIQFRVRMTASMLSNLSQWNSVWKQYIVHQGNATCASMEITHTHPNNGSTMYMECGGRHMYTTTSGPDHTESTPLLWQQDWANPLAGGSARESNGYQILYPNTSGRWAPWTDEWYTVDLKVHVGTLGAGGETPMDSSIEKWVTRQGETTRRKVISMRYRQWYDTGTSNVFNNITLTPYMTGLSTSASVDASVWYDQLIISSQPIAVPATSIV